MSIRIDEHKMLSNQTLHHAERIVDEEQDWADDHWRVSWLPGRVLDRNRAISAMTLAENAVQLRDEGWTHTHRMWPHIDGWAGELGLTGPDAVVRVNTQESVLYRQVREELAKAGVTLRRIQSQAVA